MLRSTVILRFAVAPAVVLAVSASVLLSACEGAAGELRHEDIGTLAEDAGTLADDAGTLAEDAGTLAEDAGTLTEDAGTLTEDAGTLAEDAGLLPPDSGTLAGPDGGGDAGPVVDAGAVDGGSDGGSDAGTPARADAGLDAGLVDAGLREFHVAALKLQTINPRWPSLEAKMQHVVGLIDQVHGAHQGALDLIITPEWSFTYSGSRYYADAALEFDCDASYDHCTVNAGGGVKSAAVLATIQALAQRAVARRVHLVLGTVSERVDTTGVPGVTSNFVYFNTLVVIRSDGSIWIMRKGSQDWASNCTPTSACSLAILNYTHQTIRPLTLSDHRGGTVRAMVTICSDLSWFRVSTSDVLARGNRDVDLHLHTENSGPDATGQHPTGYKLITDAIQAGTWSADQRWAKFVTGFITPFATTGIVKPTAYFLTAEGGDTTQSAFIQYVEPPTPVTDYSDTAGYLYGTIALPR